MLTGQQPPSLSRPPGACLTSTIGRPLRASRKLSPSPCSTGASREDLWVSHVLLRWPCHPSACLRSCCLPRPRRSRRLEQRQSQRTGPSHNSQESCRKHPAQATPAEASAPRLNRLQCCRSPPWLLLTCPRAALVERAAAPPRPPLPPLRCLKETTHPRSRRITRWCFPLSRRSRPFSRRPRGRNRRPSRCPPPCAWTRDPWALRLLRPLLQRPRPSPAALRPRVRLLLRP